MKEGWTYKKLGEVGTFVRGGNFSKKDFIEDGFPCIHYGQIHMKFGTETFKHLSSVPAEMVKSDRCAHKGDLVIAITSEDDAGSCKCTAWMGDYDVYVGGHAAIYRHTMQPKFVSYYFLSPDFQKAKLEFTHGFKVVEINPKDIAKISIPVPSLSEQQSIVDYLDSAFAKIDAMKANAEKALNEAKALFQASLKEMLEPKEGWEEKALGELSDKIGDGLHGTPKYTDDGEYFFVNGNNLENGFIEIKDNTKRVNHDEYEKYKLDLNSSTVLLSINGTIGKTAFYNGEPIILGKSACYINVLPTLLKEYLRYYFVSDGFFNYVKSNSRQATITNLGLKEIRRMPLPTPSLDEQQSIVGTLDSLKSKVDRLQENYNKISQECDALKQAILRQVFE